MKQNNYYSNKVKQKINKIKQLLIKKYQIYDVWLLERLALYLLKNGIGIDELNNPYKRELGIDKIVAHLKNKIIEERNQKINDTKTITEPKIINNNKLIKVKSKIINFPNRK